MIEVELKARVRDRPTVEAALGAFASLVRGVDKSDSYWKAPGWRSSAARRDFRVRSEGGTSVVTYKEKKVEGGVEVNVEREFGVTDPEAFAGLALRLGCEKWYGKRKRGLLYEAPAAAAKGGKASVEIVEVEGLGCFIEIEVLVEDAAAGAIEAARAEILGILGRAGLAEADLEGRFYSELLAEAGLATPP
jgi:predicted adenylyl cyclase CyaB